MQTVQMQRLDTQPYIAELSQQLEGIWRHVDAITAKLSSDDELVQLLRKQALRLQAKIRRLARGDHADENEGWSEKDDVQFEHDEFDRH